MLSRYLEKGSRTSPQGSGRPKKGVASIFGQGFKRLPQAIVGQKGWDPGSETTVLKSAVDVKAPKKGVVGTFGQRIQKNKVHGLVSHVIQGPQKDQSVARVDKKLEGHAT